MRRSVFVWFFLALLLLSLRVGTIPAAHLRRTTSHLLTMLHHLLLMLPAHLLMMHLLIHLMLIHRILIHRMRPVTGTLVFH